MSDCSSDVCSSDLQQHQAKRVTRTFSRFKKLPGCRWALVAAGPGTVDDTLLNKSFVPNIDVPSKCAYRKYLLPFEKNCFGFVACQPFCTHQMPEYSLLSIIHERCGIFTNMPNYGMKLVVWNF